MTTWLAIALCVLVACDMIMQVLVYKTRRRAERAEQRHTEAVKAFTQSVQGLANSLNEHARLLVAFEASKRQARRPGGPPS